MDQVSMALNTRVRTRAWRCALGLVIVMVASGCSSSVVRPPQIRVAPVRPVAAPPQVIALGQTFAHQFASGAYASQWSELAPEAQAMWPSEAARTAMLSRKFAHAPVSELALGTPALEAMWTAPEDPALRVADVWSIPIQIAFAEPRLLRPDGVAALFSMTALQIVMGLGFRVAEIVGEGPASIDAPIILPPTIPAATVAVPILMYHLVDEIPPRSIEPSAYGWRLEVGLTTLPSAFDAQMAYLASIRAHAISLQHLADAMLYGLPLPPHPFVITFDDGRLSPWTNAVPVLRRYGFTATFFPCTGLLGKKVGPQTYMTAADVQNLASTGFSIEDHTINDDTDFFSAGARLLNKLTNQTKSVLENLTGDPVQFIAYTGVWPWRLATQGTATEAGMFNTLASYGYVGGVLDLRIDSDVESSTAMWELPRVRIGLGDTIAGLARWFRDQHV